MKTTSPLWSVGFRPFFLVGALASILLIASWALQFYSESFIQNYYAPTIWHGHEMVFGFATAILAGFLLTASANWSGKKALNGRPLIGLVILWTLGRLAPFLPLSLPWLIAGIELSFIPALAYFLSPYLFAEGQGRNHKILIMLLVLFYANLLIHLETLSGLIGFDFFGFAQRGLYLGLDVIILFMLLIGGRVLPFFKTKAMNVAVAPPIPLVEKLGAALLVLFVIAGAFELTTLRSISSGLVGLIFMFKFIRWKPLETIKNPILFTLFFAFFWIIVGFLILATPNHLGLTLSSATHIFTLGGLGGFTLGFMVRVSLGHTGRPRKASPLIIFGFVLIYLCLFTRIFLTGLFTEQYSLWILATGILWVLGFLFFLIHFTPILLTPRKE